MEAFRCGKWGEFGGGWGGWGKGGELGVWGNSGWGILGSLRMGEGQIRAMREVGGGRPAGRRELLGCGGGWVGGSGVKGGEIRGKMGGRRARGAVGMGLGAAALRFAAWGFLRGLSPLLG